MESYHLDSQIRDDFQCNHDCYSQHRDPMIDVHSNTCTHDYHHITQSIQDLSDSTQQNNLHSIEENTSSFTDDTTTLCDFSIVDHHSETENTNDTSAHSHQNNRAYTHKENMHTEILLVNQTYNITTNDNGMFTAKLMNDTPIEIFTDNGATPSILPSCTYNNFLFYIHIPKQTVILLYIQEGV